MGRGVERMVLERERCAGLSEGKGMSCDTLGGEKGRPRLAGEKGGCS